ncbi:hypothetical protein LEP1GSC050_0037 [Leptospira phage vB_LbrZ_5399-LE1]|uniref:Helix-turn-helix domain-containing protein n=1 Tax=Leptospira inadai serovar Lyme TaxID=293084 RepID=A0ABX4YGB8_9LEPT|nr:hypothetical protein [Leptospira inadai]AGS80729.1 hypothetical protein LEP1GSC050_0037 [Leptospira phage vB_LbrZ_5399-LE1]AGS80879.1 hypothetical protein LEP1GSC047_0834 [Leptospira phage vB_LinZ_10-LE1]PNV74303.1 hypothetical protein BES34_014045 [Leptospira inadai serovar Lyme]
MAKAKIFHSVKRQNSSATSVANCALVDARLSFKSLGILCLALSHPYKDRLNSDYFAKRNRESKAEVIKSLRELEFYGYSELKREGDGFGKFTSHWSFYKKSRKPKVKGKVLNFEKKKKELNLFLPLKMEPKPVALNQERPVNWLSKFEIIYFNNHHGVLKNPGLELDSIYWIFDKTKGNWNEVESKLELLEELHLNGGELWRNTEITPSNLRNLWDSLENLSLRENPELTQF